jgi:hypothetical protein
MKKMFQTGRIGLMAALLVLTASGQTLPQSQQETVVLLHGLARSSKAMNKMGKALQAEGYHVINHDYPSTSAPIETLTQQVFDALEPQIKDAETIHFVTHSMGGIILRQHLETNALPNLGRVVMLAPPSRGSEIPDKLGHLSIYQWINGPAGNQLGTGTNSHPLRLKVPEFELGIIAGDRSINPVLSMLIPGPDDGKVSLDRVKPAAYTDYLQLHATHACMVWNPKVIRQTCHFIKQGKFDAEEVSMININAAWIGFALGCISGAIPGLFFHRKEWLGGYTSWPRRMIRLAHISFFGIGFLNLGLGLTSHVIGTEASAASTLMLVGAATMPTICYASAFRPVFRHLFFIPAGSVLLSIVLFIERMV